MQYPYLPNTERNMGRINYTRVLLGGLLAGVVVNISEFLLYGVILMEQMQAMMEAAGLTEASWAMVGYVLSAFVLGLVVVWIYAAIRPRFGPGWKTAVIAGAAVWVASYAIPTVWMGAMGLAYGTGTTLMALVWGFAEIALAGVAGGWLYQEGGAAPAAPAASEPPMGTPPTM